MAQPKTEMHAMYGVCRANKFLTNFFLDHLLGRVYKGATAVQPAHVWRSRHGEVAGETSLTAGASFTVQGRTL